MLNHIFVSRGKPAIAIWWPLGNTNC